MEYLGIIKEIRIFKWGGFFILETFTENEKRYQYQCIMKGTHTGPAINDLKSESYVSVIVEIVPATIKKELVVSDAELVVKELTIITEPSAELPLNIYEKTINANTDTILNLRSISLRNESFKSIFKIQSVILNSFRHILEQQEFVSISTPKIIANGSEGGTNVFSVDYFGKQAYLAQSPQLYKQMMCGVFGKVYETASVFRAEKHDSSRHINEYVSLDVETILAPRDPLSQLIFLEKVVLNYILGKLTKQKELFDYLQVTLPTQDNLLGALTITVAEAKKLLGTNGNDLTGEDEIEICKYAKTEFATDFVFVTYYPKESRPFYTKENADGTTVSFDLLYNGMEITSGGQRKHNYQEYIDTMTSLGMDVKNFGPYLDTFKYGMPLHGGFAIGLERLTAKICNVPSVKLATLFPRDVNRLNP